jgi:hypothetical protein
VKKLTLIVVLALFVTEASAEKMTMLCGGGAEILVTVREFLETQDGVLGTSRKWDVYPADMNNVPKVRGRRWEAKDGKIYMDGVACEITMHWICPAEREC